MNRAEYAPTAPPGYATVGSELTEMDNEPPFRVFKFLTQNPENNPRLDYFMDGKLLPLVEFEKDLGLNITENLQWDMHIKKIVNKAKSVIGWIKWSLISRNRLA